MLRFSLIVCTIGRRDDLRNLFQSLRDQTAGEFEVILVDQSRDDSVRTLLTQEPTPFPLLYLQSAQGLSLGRNVGLQHARGEIIAFPDDDCTYMPSTLQQVDGYLRTHPELSGITGRSKDALGRLSGPRSPDASCMIDEANIWRCGISYTIFLRRSVIEATGSFDERLGVGAGTPFGSGEETDYLLRAIRAGSWLGYIPDLVILHPGSDTLSLDVRLAKDYKYAVGFGFVLRKNGMGVSYLLPHLIKPLIASMLFLLRFDPANARLRFCRLKGRWRGYFHEGHSSTRN